MPPAAEGNAVPAVSANPPPRTWPARKIFPSASMVIPLTVIAAGKNVERGMLDNSRLRREIKFFDGPSGGSGSYVPTVPGYVLSAVLPTIYSWLDELIAISAIVAPTVAPRINVAYERLNKLDDNAKTIPLVSPSASGVVLYAPSVVGKLLLHVHPPT